MLSSLSILANKVDMEDCSVFILLFIYLTEKLLGCTSMTGSVEGSQGHQCYDSQSSMLSDGNISGLVFMLSVSIS